MGRIVVGVDGSEPADRALCWAVEEAQVRLAELEIVLAYATQFGGFRSPAHAAPGATGGRHPALAAANEALAEQALQRVVARNGEVLGRVKWSTTLAPVTTSPAHALVEAGDEAELVVVGSRGLGGFGALLLGSVSYGTAGHAPCPVAVVRHGDRAEVVAPARIVVGIDDSRGARRALRWAVDEAELRGIPLTIAHGYSAPVVHLLGGLAPYAAADEARVQARDTAERVVARALEIVDAPATVRVDRVITMASAAALMLDLAGDDTLLVVGTRGHGTIGRMVLGSVSQQVLHHATCPVVVAP